MAADAVAAAILGLALVGFLDAAYFVAVTYRWMRPDPRWLPPICRMDGAACARIVDAPQARVLGLPNSVYGVPWYAGLVALMGHVLGGGALPEAGCLLLVTAAALVVALSAYLAWSLLYRLRTHCPLCYVAHVLNAAILALLAAFCAFT